MSVTRIIGWPTLVGIEPLEALHMHWAIHILPPTRSIFFRTSAPLPIRVAPRTGRSTLPSDRKSVV